MNNNTTSIPCDFEKLNSILSSVGLIITRKQFNFYHDELWADLLAESNSKNP